MLKARRVAIVGLSDDPSRPSYRIAGYLIGHGFDVVGVNPKHETVLGRPCYRSLEDVPGPVDLVNVFRRPLACGDVARSAVATGAKGLWLQSGIRNGDAQRIASEAGIDFVQDRCIMIEHMSQR
jgi:predicted CoA-binding protein